MALILFTSIHPAPLISNFLQSTCATLCLNSTITLIKSNHCVYMANTDSSAFHIVLVGHHQLHQSSVSLVSSPLVAGQLVLTKRWELKRAMNLQHTGRCIDVYPFDCTYLSFQVHFCFLHLTEEVSKALQSTGSEQQRWFLLSRYVTFQC